jgi:hypothetical protein
VQRGFASTPGKHPLLHPFGNLRVSKRDPVEWDHHGVVGNTSMTAKYQREVNRLPGWDLPLPRVVVLPSGLPHFESPG